MTKYAIESWFTEEDLKKLEYSDYWNDEQQELSKEWNVLDGNFEKMEHFLRDNGLINDLELCVEAAGKHLGRALSGAGIDLASGNLWAVPHLFRLIKVDHLHCLEYSRHRLLKLGPFILDHYRVPEEKVTLVFGSFYELKISDNSLDFVFLSQAFHHADKPDILMDEVSRVLKPNGVVIMIGEHVVNLPLMRVKHTVKNIIATVIPESIQLKMFGRLLDRGGLFASKAEMLAADPVAGDHYYTNQDYISIFRRNGFSSLAIRSSKPAFQSFVLYRV